MLALVPAEESSMAWRLCEGMRVAFWAVEVELAVPAQEVNSDTDMCTGFCPTESRTDLAEKHKVQEAAVLMRLAQGASNKLNASDGSLQIMQKLVAGESLTANPQGAPQRRSGEFQDSAESVHGMKNVSFTAP